MRFLATSMLAGMLLVSGCRQDHSISPQTRDRIERAQSAYEAGQDDETLKLTTAVILEEGSGRGATKARYLRGLAKYRKGDLEGAMEDFREVYGSAFCEDLRIYSADALGEIMFRRGNLEKTIELFREVLRETQRSQKPRDHACYRLGCSMQRMGKWKEGAKYFYRLKYEFPESGLRVRAEKMARGQAWSIQAGAYRNQQVANTEAAKFSKAGFDVAVKPALDSRDQLLYMVLIGRWNTYDSAAARLPAVKKVEAEAFLRVVN